MKNPSRLLIALLICATVTSVFFYNRARAATTYTWNQTGSASWAVSTNWTPTRTTPAVDDILVFNNAATTTVTNVPTQTIGQLSVSGNTTVNLQGNAAGTVLTIGGGAGTDLSVASGSALNINVATNTTTITLAAGATGSISGNMMFSTAAHKLDAVDANAITFNSGATLTQAAGCTGNIFTAAGTANAVVFASGSTFTQQAGANPFGLAAPASKVVFQSGSLFSFQQNALPGFSGRTYANLDINFATYNQTSVGGGAFTVDNLTVTLGVVHLQLTNVTIKGNISVAASQTLDFNPAAAAAIGLAGTSAQTITSNGTLTFNANANITVSNINGVTLNNSLTWPGTNVVNAGASLASAGTLTSSGTMTVNGNFQINQGGNATGNNFVYNAATGTLVFNNSAGSFAVSGTPVYWPASNGPQNVNVQGGGGITMSVARTVGSLFQYAAGVSGAGNLTLTGTTQVNTGGFTSGSPTYGGVSSLLKYNTGGTYGRNGEWLPGATSGAGYPTHVQLSNNTTLDLPNSSAGSTFQMAGDLTIDSGSTMQLSGATPLTQTLTIFGSVNNNGILNLSNSSGGDVNVGGNWNNNGTFNNNGRTVNLNGSVGQAISGNSNFFNLTKSSAVAQTLTFAALSTQTVTNNLTLNGAAGNLLNLRSNTPGTQWKLNVLGAQAVSFVDVQDSDASGGVTINPTSSVNSGNNIHWTFGGPADYNVTVSGPAIVVDDVSGNSDTLTISEPGPGQIKFAAPGRFFSINGGPSVSGDSGNLLIPTSSITVHAAAGNDIINVGGFATSLPSLGISGGAGDDTVNFTGSLTFDPGRDLSVDLQSDPIPGIDSILVNPGANITLSGSGPLSFKVSRNITINGPSTIQVANGNLTLEANQQASPTAGNFQGIRIGNATLTTTGTGNISLKGKGGVDATTANHQGIFITSGSSSSLINSTSAAAGAGTITLNGTGGTGLGANRGMEVITPTATITSVTGDILLTGQGGTGGTNNYGVSILNGPTVSSTGAAKITFNGTGGSGTTGQTGSRVSGEDTKVTSAGGDISITGNGGPGTSSNHGVSFAFGALVSVTNSAQIIVNGTGGSGTSSNVGVVVSQVGPTNNIGTKISSSGSGNIQFTAQGGSGTSFGNIGWNIDSGASVVTSGANISITGTGGSGTSDCYGVGFDSANVAGTGVSTTPGGGNITITGVASETNGTDQDGVRFEDSVGAQAVFVNTTSIGGVVITGTAGNNDPTSSGINIVDDTTMTLGNALNKFIADTMDIGNSNVSINANSNGLQVRQKTNGRLIDFGGADSATQLGLTDAELDVISAGTLDLGEANSGAVTVSANITRSSSSTVNLISGANLDIAGGSLDTAGGFSTLFAITNIFPSHSGVDVTTSPQGLGVLSQLNIVINSTTVDSGYTQLNVAGQVSINNIGLNLSGTHTPALGQQFIIVNNDGTDPINGNFTGLFEGALITNFLGSGLNASISYVGGTGNDAVLTVVAPVETTVAISGGGSLVITDVNGFNSNDNLTLMLNAGNVRVTDPDNVLGAGAGATQVNANTVDVPLASISGIIQVDTFGGDDLLTLNFTAGNFLPGAGMIYAGGAQTSSPGDRLAIVGGAQGTVTYNYTNANDGSIVMSALGTVEYTGLEPISNTGTAADIIFNLPPAGSLAFLEDDGTSGNSISRLRSAGSFETTDFANPVGSVTINTGNANDLLSVSSPVDFTPGLTAGTLANPFQSVAFEGGLNLAPGKNLLVEASGTISIGSAASTATLSTGGVGVIQINGRDITIGPFAGSSISVGGGNLTLSANNASSAGNFTGIRLDGATLSSSGTGNISLTGKGGSDAGTSQHVGISINASSSLSSTYPLPGAGTITLNGTGAAGAGANAGVNILNSQVSSFRGDISITGHGGGSGVQNHGVDIQSSVLSSTGLAKITIDGTPGDGTDTNIGVRLLNSGTQVVSSGGDISIAGHQAATTGSNNSGVFVNDALVSGSGSAMVKLDGTAGTGGSGIIGVLLSGSNATVSSAADVQVIGDAGNGSGARHIGVNLNLGAKVLASGSANLLVDGTGGNGTTDCYGVGVDGQNIAGTTISAVNGNITINGSAGTPAGTNMDGVRLENSSGAQAVAVNTTGSGTLTINGTAGNTDATSSGINLVDDCTMSLTGASNTFIADTMDFGTSNVSINAGSNALTLRQKTNTRLISLGGADDPTQLGLTDTELDLIAAGTLNLGNANSGAITVLANITRAAATALTLTSGANIDIAGGTLNSNGGNVSLVPGTYAYPSNNGVDVTTGAAATLALTSAKGLQIIINNTTVNTGYTQLNVAGLINLNNANLQLSGTHTPSFGQQFTIVNNDAADPISGTFNGLPEGATITNFLGSGMSAIITYTGGSGNDAVLTVVNPCPGTFTVNSTGDAGDLNPGDGVCLTSTAVCTLRAAVQEANASFPPCVVNINFNIGSATITVSSELPLNHSMNINGPSAFSVSVIGSAATPTRVFNVSAVSPSAINVSLSNLTVGGGRAVFGAGLLANGSLTTTTLNGMLFTANTAVDGTGVAGGGGAATVNGGTLNIRNSTISGNTGTNGGGLLILGGGPLNLVNTTVTNNNADGNTGSGACSVDGDGGGIGGPTMPVANINLRNSIVTGNQDCNSNNPNITISGGFNNQGNNLTSGNSLLGPLANNGGPTFTHALLNLSPAIDAGNDCVLTDACAPPIGVNITTDQRGFPRPANGDTVPGAHVDIGAFEQQIPSASDGSIVGRIVDSSGDPVAGVAVRLSGAQDRLAVTDAAGNYRFDEIPAGGFFTVTPSRANYTFAPAERSFSQIGEQTSALFTASATGSVLNPLDTTEYFVRQQYLDFLNREPDEAGLSFWVHNIDSCGAANNCRAAKRVDTSAAFFLSIEFHETGYLLYRVYQSAYGAIPGTPVPLNLAEFRPDTALLADGLIVNGPNWQARLEANKVAFLAAFVARSRFTSAYPATLTPAEFVDRMFLNAGITAESRERVSVIAEFGGAATSADPVARARALRRVAENATFAEQETNRAFVLMQYFGYLDRDPNALPDGNFSGYEFWLNKLSSFNGDFRRAELVKAFLVAGEYRDRFAR